MTCTVHVAYYKCESLFMTCSKEASSIILPLKLSIYDLTVNEVS